MSAENKQEKPKCELIGQNGNIFNLVGIASQGMRHAGQGDKVKELQSRVMKCGSYGEALDIIKEYVEIIGPEEDEEECEYCGIPGCHGECEEEE